MEMEGKVTDKESENDLTWFVFDKVCLTRPSCFKVYYQALVELLGLIIKPFDNR
jgi:hypothetical protein